jgi:hypothetical protein
MRLRNIRKMLEAKQYAPISTAISDGSEDVMKVTFTDTPSW